MKKFLLPDLQSLTVGIVVGCEDDLNLALLACTGHSAVGAGVGPTMAGGLCTRL